MRPVFTNHNFQKMRMYRLCGFVNFGSSFKNTYTLKDQIESVQIVSYTDIPIKKIVEVVVFCINQKLFVKTHRVMSVWDVVFFRYEVLRHSRDKNRLKCLLEHGNTANSS